MRSATAPEREPGLGAAAPEGRLDALGLAAVMAGHAANDAYMGFLYPLLPLLVEKHGISLALTGLLITAFNATGSLSQPLFGFYADRVHRRGFVVAGPAVTGLFVSAAGLAPSYAFLFALMILGGIGSGFFHPAAVTIAALCSGRHRGLGLALFVAAGRVGVGMGSALATFLAARWGLEGSAWAAFLALGAGLLLWAASPPLGAPPPGKARSLRGALANLNRARWPLFLLGTISLLRTAVAVGMGTYLPLYLVERGASLALAGASVTLFLFAGAAGGILGGHLSDLLGRRAVILASLATSVPSLVLFFLSPGFWKLPWLVLSGALIYTSMSVLVAKAQEEMPDNVALSSSLMLGVAWFLGSAVVMGFGAAADRVGLGPTLSVGFPLATAAATALAFALPREEERRLPEGARA